MAGQAIATCELNVTTRSVGALIVLGVVGGFCISPFIALNVYREMMFGVNIGFLGGIIALIVGISSLVFWGVLCRLVVKRLGLSDHVTLEQDRLVFRDHDTIHFRDITAFCTDNLLNIRVKGKGTLLLTTSKQGFRPFCQAFIPELKRWSTTHPELNAPVQKYFYGGWMARSIGWGILLMISGVVAMAFTLGVGTAPAIAIGVVSLPVSLKLALGKRPPAGRLDEEVKTRRFEG